MEIIALEGADGAGKSTQAARLVERLRSQGYRARCVRPVFLLFDPWRLREEADGSPPYSPRRHRRSLEKVRRSGGRAPARSLLLGVVGYAYALAGYFYLRTFLRHQEFVICDRYFYQFLFDVAGPMAVKTALVFPRPDRAFLLEARPEVLRRRKSESVGAGDYLESVVGYYRDLASTLGFVRIDANQDERSVGEMIWRTFWDGPRGAVS